MTETEFFVRFLGQRKNPYKLLFLSFFSRYPPPEKKKNSFWDKIFCESSDWDKKIGGSLEDTFGFELKIYLESSGHIPATNVDLKIF